MCIVYCISIFALYTNEEKKTGENYDACVVDLKFEAIYFQI